jgi:hypothetical protein
MSLESATQMLMSPEMILNGYQIAESLTEPSFVLGVLPATGSYQSDPDLEIAPLRYALLSFSA